MHSLWQRAGDPLTERLVNNNYESKRIVM